MSSNVSSVNQNCCLGYSKIPCYLQIRTKQGKTGFLFHGLQWVEEAQTTYNQASKPGTCHGFETIQRLGPQSLPKSDLKGLTEIGATDRRQRSQSSPKKEAMKCGWGLIISW